MRLAREKKLRRGKADFTLDHLDRYWVTAKGSCDREERLSSVPNTGWANGDL
jgi:hypothetical protein